MLSKRPTQSQVHKQQVQQLERSMSRGRAPPPPEPKRVPRVLGIQEAASVIQRAWRRHIVSLTLLFVYLIDDIFIQFYLCFL